MVWDLRRGVYTKPALHSNQGKEMAENGVVCHLVINNDKNQLRVWSLSFYLRQALLTFLKKKGPNLIIGNRSKF